jgi:hypothetical protein
MHLVQFGMFIFHVFWLLLFYHRGKAVQLENRQKSPIICNFIKLGFTAHSCWHGDESHTLSDSEKNNFTTDLFLH